MALSNKFNQLSLYGGGSTPTWKRLGYSSQAEYINALTGADRKKKNPTPLEEAYGSNSAIQLSPQDRLGNFDQDVVAKVWNGGGSGGVTDEGVVIGNPNVEKFPTIKNSSSGKTSTDTLASMKETTPTATGGGSVPAATGGGSLAGTGGSEGIEAKGSNEFGAKYQGNDFLEWYKANYGTDYDPSQGFSRGQGMSDVDWAIGSNLYNSYLTGQNLENSYNSSKSEVENNYAAQSEALKNIYEQSVSRLDELYQAEIEKLQQNYGMSVDSLDTSKRNSQQAASITLDKLKKYLPTQIKAQGLGGLGVSESSMLQAYNEYNNRMGEIEGSYNANRASLDASYNDSKSALDTTRSSGVSDASLEYQKNQSALDTNRNSALSELERAYLENKTNLGVVAGEQSQNIFDKYLADYKAEQSELYNQALYALESSGYSTEEELTSFLNQYRGVLNNENLQTLEQTAKGIVAQNAEQKRLEAEQKAKAEQSELYNQALYALESSGYSTEEELTSFLNQYRGVLNNENLQTLEQTAKGIVAQNAEQKRLEAEQKAEADRLAAKENVMDYWALMQTDPANYRVDSNGNQIVTEEARNRMQQYLDANRAALGDNEYNSLKSQLDNMKVYTEADRQKEEAEAQAEKDKRIITGQESIEYDGRYYQLQSQLNKNANQIKRNNDFKDKLKALGYSDPFDPNIPNGTTIKSNVDNRGSNDFNLWDDVGAFLLSPFGAGAWDSWGNWNEITMTYYNGNWYLSAEV